MKLLYVHDRFGSLAGAEANAYITAAEFKARGHTVGILHGLPTGKGESAWSETFGFRFPLPEPSADAARHALDDFQPDVVYVHKMADLGVISALVNSGVPLVRMVHDHDIYCMRSYKYGYFSRKVCTRAAGPFCVFGCGAFLARGKAGKFPLKYVSYFDKRREIELNQQFDRMIVVTPYMRDELLRNDFDPERIEIHAPVPPMGERGLRSSFSNRNLILYAGQIIRGKGVDVLLRSLALVGMPFECVILGDGNHKPYCEELSRKLGLEKKVTFKGFVPQAELKEYYRECSVVAISSVWPEPIATIGLEVMRYGLPVVAFDAGGIKDWLTHGYNGFLVPWMDTVAYARSLERLLDDKALARRIGENGYEFVTREYDFGRYIEDLEGLFERVIASRSRTRPVYAQAS